MPRLREPLELSVVRPYGAHRPRAATRSNNGFSVEPANRALGREKSHVTSVRDGAASKRRLKPARLLAVTIGILACFVGGYLLVHYGALRGRGILGNHKSDHTLPFETDTGGRKNGTTSDRMGKYRHRW